MRLLTVRRRRDSGRQPWVAYGFMRTEEAVSPADGLALGFYAVPVVYVALTAMTVWVMRRLVRPARLAGAAGAR